MYTDVVLIFTKYYLLCYIYYLIFVISPYSAKTVVYVKYKKEAAYIIRYHHVGHWV